MKTPRSHSVRILTAIACSLFTAIVCTEKTHAAPPEATQPSSTPVKEAWQTTKDAAQTAATATREAVSALWEKSKDASYRQREALREKMKAAEASLDTKIREWSVKKDAVADEAKPAVAAAHKEVQEARAVLGQKIDALDNATEETWSSVKAELNTAWQRMTTAASDLAAKLQS